MANIKTHYCLLGLLLNDSSLGWIAQLHPHQMGSMHLASDKLILHVIYLIPFLSASKFECIVPKSYLHKSPSGPDSLAPPYKKIMLL